MNYQDFRNKYKDLPITDTSLRHIWNRFNEDMAIKTMENTKKYYLMSLEKNKVEPKLEDITEF